MTRDARQDTSIEKYLALPRKVGTLEACTGFGKTRVAVRLVKLLRRDDPTRKVVVVVPGIELKNQWESVLESAGESNHTYVYVVNTFVTLRVVETKMLILDEIHRYAAPTFRQIFDVAKYDFALGLTATLSRMDGLHDILQDKLPVFDVIRLSEAKRNGWLSPYREYNLGLELSEEEKEEYLRLKSVWDMNFSFFSSNFNVMQKCSFSIKPYHNRELNTYSTPLSVRKARRLGFHGNTTWEAAQIFRKNNDLPRGSPEKQDPWGNVNHPYHPSNIQLKALLGLRASKAMNELLDKNILKIDAAEKLIRELNRKTITFAQNVESAENLKSRFAPETAVIYHSSVGPQEKEEKVVKTWKTERGVVNFLNKNSDWNRGRGYSAWTMKTKKVPATQVKREAIHRIKNDPDTLVMCTARALDEGFDYEAAQLGLSLSRSSNPNQQVQRTGRIVRFLMYDDGSVKEAVMINLYFKDTRDYHKLLKAQQKSAPGIIWVDSVDDIISAES